MQPQTVSSFSYKLQYGEPIACVANLLVHHPGLAVALSFKRPPFAARSPLPPRVKLSHVAGLAFLGGPRFGLALPVTLRCRSIEPERLVTSSFDRELSTGRVRLPVHLVSRTSLVFQLPFVYMFVWSSSFRSCTWSSGVPASVRVPGHLGFQLPFVYMFVWGSSFRSCTWSFGVPAPVRVPVLLGVPYPDSRDHSTLSSHLGLSRSAFQRRLPVLTSVDVHLCSRHNSRLMF